MVRVRSSTGASTKIENKRMDELKVGDHVESYDPETNSVAFSEVYFISHDGQTGDTHRLLNLVIGTDDGKESSLRLHPKHLVYACRNEKTKTKTDSNAGSNLKCVHPPETPLTAESFKIGDIVWLRNSDGKFSPRQIIDIGESWSDIRHPMTLNHFIVVDDVLASVHVYDEALYRQLTFPLRFLYGKSPSMIDSLMVKKLVEMWDHVENNFF